MLSRAFCVSTRLASRLAGSSASLSSFSLLPTLGGFSHASLPSFSSQHQQHRRALHSSAPRRGLEEFFTNYDQDQVGGAWQSPQLRLKSSEDLRKLWFVLLKERNMLLTYKRACKQRRTKMRNPTRLFKVRLSMARIRQVISARARTHLIQESPRYRIMYEMRREKSKRLRKPIQPSTKQPTILQWKQYKPTHPMFHKVALKRLTLLQEYVKRRREVMEGERRRMPRRMRSRMRSVELESVYRPAEQTWRNKPDFVPGFIQRRLDRDSQMLELQDGEVAGEASQSPEHQKLKAELKEEFEARQKAGLMRNRRRLQQAINDAAARNRKPYERWMGQERSYKLALGQDYELPAKAAFEQYERELYPERSSSPQAEEGDSQN